LGATFVIGGDGVFAKVLPAYRGGGVFGDAWIHCLLCDSISHNRHDVENRYCGACHLFHDIVEEGRRLVVYGAAHECSEWAPARGLCALCGGEV